jgi:hypothetical protein
MLLSPWPDSPASFQGHQFVSYGRQGRADGSYILGMLGIVIIDALLFSLLWKLINAPFILQKPCQLEADSTSTPAAAHDG